MLSADSAPARPQPARPDPQERSPSVPSPPPNTAFPLGSEPQRMPSRASLQPAGIPRHRFAALGGCSPAPRLVPRSLRHPAVPRGATRRAWPWLSSLPVATPGCSSRPAPLHAGHAAPIATPHGSATLSVPSKPLLPRPTRCHHAGAGCRQETGLWSLAEPLGTTPGCRASVSLRHPEALLLEPFATASEHKPKRSRPLLSVPPAQLVRPKQGSNLGHVPSR